MNRSADELNRDQIIADRIAKAATQGNRVVAVVGGDHLDGIAEKLPEKITPEKRAPAYGIYSWQHAKEIATPAFTAVSVLFVLYLTILELFRWVLLLA